MPELVCQNASIWQKGCQVDWKVTTGFYIWTFIKVVNLYKYP